MELLTLENMFEAALLGFIPVFYVLSPASKSTKVWTIFYLTIAILYLHSPETFKATLESVRNYARAKPVQAGLAAVSIGVPLKYIQRKLRFQRINAIKMKYGYTDDPASYKDMTVEQAQEIESNMAEWEFPRLWQFGWISDFFRTSTDPGVCRTINSSGHFINDDKRIEHQRMQATIHLMTAFAAYKVKSHNHSLVIARINEHHHRYGIKINSDDILYLVIHFGLAPVPWINRFGYRKLEPFEVHAMYTFPQAPDIINYNPNLLVSWVLWRELGCRMGVKYIPKTLDQANEWRRKFENTFRWREDANEIMARAMLDQVLYPVPGPLKNFVAKVFVSIVDWDIVYYCQLEKLHPSHMLREVAFDFFRLCGWLIREFGLPRLSPYQRSPPEPNKEGKMNFGHTPYDTMPFWQERSFWNLWGPRALFGRLLGLPRPSPEFQSDGVPLEAMGAPHMHPPTQAAIEEKVRENAAILEKAPYGYRPAIGWQANRLLAPVDGPTYGSDMNVFPEGTPTTPNSPLRFTRDYERRGGGFSKVINIEKPEDVKHFDAKEAAQKQTVVPQVMNNVPHAFQTAPAVSVSA